MRWGRDWPERVPRPKVAKLSRDALERLRAHAAEFVEESVALRELIKEVQLARGRLYFWREADDLMARITPLGPKSMLLESPRRETWREEKRGPLATVLKVLEADTLGTFHGLGALAGRRTRGEQPVQLILHRELGIPPRVLAEPRYWYSMHREPTIAEISDRKDRALVHFSSVGMFGSFHGTCLYALRNGDWGCYTIRPNASATIASAEAWLEKRAWNDWD